VSSQDPQVQVGKPRLLLATLTGYQRRWFRADVFAALTVWAVLVPESLAYATIAGVSPVVGLYAAPLALLVYALLGTSRVLVTATMSSSAALSAATVADIATDKANFVAITIALALVVGLLGVLAGVLRLGFLASFISLPVLRGFIVGIALTIVVSQVPDLIGITSVGGDFFQRLWDLAQSVSQLNGLTLAVGATGLAAILLLRRFVPQVPGMLTVVVLSIVASRAFDLSNSGVAVVGNIPPGLPSFGLPNLNASEYVGLIGPGIGILLVGFAEAIAAAKTYAGKDDLTLNPDRELIATGAASVGAGLSSGMVVNGSLSKTAVNEQGGARSQVSNILVAILVVVTLLFLTAPFEQLPQATLAAVVIAAVIQLVDITGFRQFYGFYSKTEGHLYGLAARPDFLASLAAVFGVLVFGILPGLFIGISVSVLLIVYRSSRPHVAVLGRDPSEHWVDSHRHPNTTSVPGVLVVRPESGLFYANADNVHDAIIASISAQTFAVVIDAEAVPDIDLTALLMLDRLSTELKARDIRVLVASEVGQVRDLLRSASFTHLTAGLYPTIAEAVAAAVANHGQ